jgi:CubicO group peptidase (beta-lactamase class C family)
LQLKILTATRAMLRASACLLSFLVCCPADASVARKDALDYRPITGVSPQPLPANRPATREELEGFADGLMALQMKTKPIAGAVIAVVKDGELFFAKGYGHANVEKGIAVDAGRTLFRIGSVSKLFTWTAVMQLVEQGRLDLDADVNAYLKDFKIPATQPEPVTLRNLMTHTGGFEEGFLGYAMPETDEGYVPLSEYLRSHMPARARPATTDFSNGTRAAYSNWGTVLAGHIVEAVSGMSFDEYIERNIFQPLQMTSSTFREPLPRDLAERTTTAYEFDDGEFVPREFERWHNTAPAASLSLTATDIAQFMLAHLQDGALGEARLLKPQTARLMHARALSTDPVLNAMDLGFRESWINGRRVIGHGGSTLYFHSQLSLVPEANLGLFVAFNTAEAGEAGIEIERAFMDHYFPAALPQVAPRADAAERSERYTGTYRILRRSETKIEKIFAATGDFSVGAEADGTLVMAHPFVGYGDTSGKPTRWVEVGDGVFRQINDGIFVAFKANDDGKLYLVGLDALHPFERIAWYENFALHGMLLALAFALFISVLVSAVRRRRMDREGPRSLRWARPVLALAGTLLIAFAVGLIGVASGGIEAFATHVPPALYVVLTLPLLAIPLSVAGVFFAAAAWRSGAWTLPARLHYTAAVLAALAFTGVLNYWNLLGYRFG